MAEKIVMTFFMGCSIALSIICCILFATIADVEKEKRFIKTQCQKAEVLVDYDMQAMLAKNNQKGDNHE